MVEFSYIMVDVDVDVDREIYGSSGNGNLYLQAFLVRLVDHQKNKKP